MFTATTVVYVFSTIYVHLLNIVQAQTVILHVFLAVTYCCLKRGTTKAVTLFGLLTMSSI